MRRLRFFTAACLIILCASSLFSQEGRGGGQQPGGAAPGGGRAGGQSPAAGAQGGKPSPVTIAELTEKYQSISAGGRLKPKISVDHQTTAAGTVAAVYVRQGQQVAEGQELFSIERDSTAGSFKPAVVTARIAGVVSDISVQPRDGISAGQKGVTIVGTGGYLLEATISDKDAFKVSVGENITGHTVDGKVLQGFLTGRSIEPDYSTGLFSLTFEFPNGQDTHIGEFVMVDLPVDRTRGIFLNRELLVRRYGKFFLWIVNTEKVLEIREVKTGAVIGDEVLILDGLKPGDSYLSRLTGREKEGNPVTPPAQ